MATTQVDEREARRVAEAARQTEWRQPSFAKELYLGRFRLDLIHPHPRQSPQDQSRADAFLAELRSLCETELDGSVIEREAQIPDEYIKALARIGVFGMKVPREYGGVGLSQVGYNHALMLLGAVHPSVGALVSAHQSIGVPEPVKLFGSEAQKRAFLPRCAHGAISAFLLTEPDVGSDPARLAAPATPVDGGTAYEIDGLKLWTTNGVIAELLVVMARVPEHEGGRGGITAFVVEADSPGITVVRRNAFMPLPPRLPAVRARHRPTPESSRAWGTTPAARPRRSATAGTRRGPAAGSAPREPRGDRPSRASVLPARRRPWPPETAPTACPGRNARPLPRGSGW